MRPRHGQGPSKSLGPATNFRSFFSLPSSGQFVEHFLVQFGVRLFAKGQENVPADVLVNDLYFGGVAFETVGISVNVKRQFFNLNKFLCQLVLIKCYFIRLFVESVK